MDLSNPASLLLAGIYYIITGLLIFFSIFSVYILNRHGESKLTALAVSHGESKLTALAVSLLYSVFFLAILAQSFNTLQSIK
ncbi:MAG: hypothetical protein NTX98_02435 [Candidatus Doudnabacteria bacterium]|nr:hypothetical protein [Candidatus Doudnabacteria bacterium]